MSIKKRIGVFILISSLLPYSFAQEKDTYLAAGGGTSYVMLGNQNFSPVNHTGFVWLASLNFLTETASYIDDLSLFFRKGKLGLDNLSGAADPKTALTMGNIYYTHARRLHRNLTGKNQFFPGGNFSSSVSFWKRTYDGDENYYCYHSSIGPSIIFRHNFSWNERLRFDGQLDFSLVTYIIQPAYGSIMPEKLLDKELTRITWLDYIAGGKIVTLNKFQRINCIAGLIYKLSDRIALRLGYNLDFFHVKLQYENTQVVQSANISFIID